MSDTVMTPERLDAIEKWVRGPASEEMPFTVYSVLRELIVALRALTPKD